ncbi:hypothetical protein SEVIR_3G096300v4 [Setaria viridis]|uniref:Uncharacterized protein n=1 Tax=Setaria viridis TaxID=4556 RepID=A0A4U6V7D7_SETVI|nr:hypothetical protein SEVIR_3G096300v2 [Setaria viridis]
MADEPSDACSRTDGDGVRAGRNNKRKSSQACSYRFIIRNERECYVISVFAAVVFLLVYLFTEYDDEEESDEEDGEEEGERCEEDGKEEDEEEEGNDEGEEEEDGEAHAELLKVTVDCFIATKAWAELELGSGNANIKEIVGMLRFIPGYDEAVKARQDRKP